MIRSFIPLLSSFTSSGLFLYIFYPIMGLALLATVPRLMRTLFGGKRYV